MKRTIAILCAVFALVSTVAAQRITHNFQDISMSDALKLVQHQTDKYKIIFIYDDLEDFKVTTSVKGKSVPDALRQMIGFYPISMTVNDDNEIYVDTQTLQTNHGCDSVVTLHLTITVGVDNYYGIDFMVYPNPTDNIINIQFTNNYSPITEIRVYDMYGKILDVVRTNNYSSMPSEMMQIDLSRFASGVYFIKALSDGNVR